MTDNFCPLTRLECKEKDCMWFVNDDKNCAVFVMAWQLRDLGRNGIDVYRPEEVEGEKEEEGDV